MESGAVKYVCSFAIGLGLLCAVPVMALQSGDIPDVPSQSKLDTTTASQLRPQLMAQSSPGSGRYGTARLVFDQLLAQVRDHYHGKIEWQLRIVRTTSWNAYSSPDGACAWKRLRAWRVRALTVGILSGEIAHVMRHDWVRRYAYQNTWNTAVPPSCWAIPVCLVSWILRRRPVRIGALAGRWNSKPTGRPLDNGACGCHLISSPRCITCCTLEAWNKPAVDARCIRAGKSAIEVDPRVPEASIEFARQWPERMLAGRKSTGGCVC